MDILIKNMEMPTNCFTCIFSWLNDYGILVCTRLGKECTRSEVRSDCPLVALPPHGDLVDVQAIEERAKEIQYERCITYNEALLLAFDEASVVVEATE